MQDISPLASIHRAELLSVLSSARQSYENVAADGEDASSTLAPSTAKSGDSPTHGEFLSPLNRRTPK
jgi:hypothetical protein